MASNIHERILGKRLPNYYQLLDLKIFEDDIKLIREASEKKIEELEQLKDEISEQDEIKDIFIRIDEISNVLGIFENKKSKDEYDKQYAEKRGINLKELQKERDNSIKKYEENKKIKPFYIYLIIFICLGSFAGLLYKKKYYDIEQRNLVEIAKEKERIAKLAEENKQKELAKIAKEKERLAKLAEENKQKELAEIAKEKERLAKLAEENKQKELAKIAKEKERLAKLAEENKQKELAEASKQKELARIAKEKERIAKLTEEKRRLNDVYMRIVKNIGSMAF